MFTLGPIGFLAPLALAGLLALPLLWWLMRLIPPAPRRQRFPAIRLIMRLINPEESTAKTPLWLILLRLALLIAIILGAAHPVINARQPIAGSGALILIVDDGWAAAHDWAQRKLLFTDLMAQAQRDGRPVAIVTTAPTPVSAKRALGSLLAADKALEELMALAPKPWPVALEAAGRGLDKLQLEKVGQVIWLSNGLNAKGAGEFAARLAGLGPLSVYADPAAKLPVAFLPLKSDRKGLGLSVRRVPRPTRLGAGLIAVTEGGTVVARRTLSWKAGQDTAKLRLDLPVEMRNRITRIEVENQNTAGATLLVDERWRRRPVGLLSDAARKRDQPLLDDLYYLDRALDPFTEVRVGPLADLLKWELAMLVMADFAKLDKGDEGTIGKWLAAGGVVVRFAGPRLARSGSTLLPVRLRKGRRELGGALSWRKPQRLAPFAAESPFGGLKVPGDVRIRRQVLARPTADLPDRTWASLADGTPLVTAEKRGKGWLVLVHTTASPAWSNLPLSGLFVQMLRQLIRLGRGVTGVGDARPLAPLFSVDGFGRLVKPMPGATALNARDLTARAPGPAHPPGFYGQGEARRAYNLAPFLAAPTALSSQPVGVEPLPYQASSEEDFRPWLFTLALLLVIADMWASFVLRGFFRFATPARAAGLVLCLMILAAPAMAQKSPAASLTATLKVHLAYVETGNDEIDRVTRAGLSGLGLMANQRTAADMGQPIAVDPASDELSFFSLIYWPITDDTSVIGAAAAKRINDFLKRGGTILFDTRDQGGGGSGGRLAEIGAGLDIPPLRVIPADHVLGRSYYLLREFPGRWTGGRVWVERRPRRVNDGVSSIIVGSHDWAGAWAMDKDHRPLYPVVPGGKRQRELAYRFGINLLMYVLTGNYKTDQVHLPAIMERLGQ